MDPTPTPQSAAFEWKGRTYVLPAVTQDAKRTFHALANAYALAQVRATEAFAEPEAFARDYARAMELVTTGHYAFHARGGWLFRDTLPGVVRLVYACLLPAYPRLTLAEVEAMGERTVAAERDGRPCEVNWLGDLLLQANANPTDASPTPPPSGGNSAPGSPSSTASPAAASAA